MSDIIIPVLQDKIPERFIYCLNSIFTNTKDFNLICVVSGKSQPKNINTGLDRAKSDYIAILDWDIIVSPRWLKILIQNLEENKTIGIIGAKMTGTYQGWNRDAPMGVTKWPVLAGGCMVFRNIGLRFDETYPSGYWADTDFCRHFRDKGYEIAINGDVEVEHFVETFTNNTKQTDKWSEIGKEIYRNKWGEGL